ncbi:tenomodulin-like isoform X2 [Myxocyprinus asiaticus]|uniref:tenomodulin-like isoform X2 n=1 Tax=Myxocyprinus asiaticus TaxID=70543 RepID=UPI0022219D9D|nr:tenomodulin-like isoform X2 [Myxocyprinus asiaticus]
MESNPSFSSHQVLCKDVELGKEEERKARYHSYQYGAIILSVLFLTLALSIYSLRYIWSPSPLKVYNHHYKAVLDGMETESMMKILPDQRIEIFRMGNSTDEVLEVHDFKNGIMGIRFAKHQRCYIRTQTKQLPKLMEVDAKNVDIEVGETGEIDMQVVDSQIWIPAEEPISNRTFLLNSKISEVCQELPIHWIHPSPLRDAEFHDIEDVEESPELEVRGPRQARDVMDQLPVNDYPLSLGMRRRRRRRKKRNLEKRQIYLQRPKDVLPTSSSNQGTHRFV